MSVMREFEAVIAISEDEVKEAIEKMIRSRYSQLCAFAYPTDIDVQLKIGQPRVGQGTVVVPKLHEAIVTVTKRKED